MISNTYDNNIRIIFVWPFKKHVQNFLILVIAEQVEFVYDYYMRLLNIVFHIELFKDLITMKKIFPNKFLQ